MLASTPAPTRLRACSRRRRRQARCQRGAPPRALGGDLQSAGRGACEGDAAGAAAGVTPAAARTLVPADYGRWRHRCPLLLGTVQ